MRQPERAIGRPQERQRLFDRFVETVGLPRIQELVRILQPTDDREVQSVLGRYCIRANPKASRGYLYLGAHELPSGSQTKEFEKGAFP